MKHDLSSKTMNYDLRTQRGTVIELLVSKIFLCKVEMKISFLGWLRQEKNVLFQKYRLFYNHCHTADLTGVEVKCPHLVAKPSSQTDTLQDRFCKTYGPWKF